MGTSAMVSFSPPRGVGILLLGLLVAHGSACDYGTCCGYSETSRSDKELIEYVRANTGRAQKDCDRLPTYKWLEDMRPWHKSQAQAYSSYCLTPKERPGCTPCTRSVLGVPTYCKRGEVCECGAFANFCRKVPPSLLPKHMAEFEAPYQRSTMKAKEAASRLIRDKVQGGVKAKTIALVVAAADPRKVIEKATKSVAGKVLGVAAMAANAAQATVSLAAMAGMGENEE